MMHTELDPHLDTMSIKEDSLVFIFENLLSKQNEGTNKYIIKREIDCWQGRADLVTAEVKGDSCINNEQAIAMSNLTNAQILALLHKKAPRSIQYLRNKTCLSEQTVKKSLRELMNLNVVTIDYKGNYIFHSDFQIPKVTFNAYEAKLHNWKRALYQAIQYYGFSQYSWVIMPEQYIKPAQQNIYSFKENGIGLIGMDKHGNRKIYLKAKKNQPSRKAFYLVGIGKMLQTED
ncbi:MULTISPECIES: helix-turn-helix transcriptional regulator [Bacillus cereus group]|uniref:helix-turn-helix transcriptional regulator n=1 Tax=Bacillus cereus group TaxID=86661 RepID=UPI001145953A|nr:MULTISPECIES: helix-turn-helix transcriptional regulator [Bacillus cereus group]